MTSIEKPGARPVFFTPTPSPRDRRTNRSALEWKKACNTKKNEGH